MIRHPWLPCRDCTMCPRLLDAESCLQKMESYENKTSIPMIAETKPSLQIEQERKLDSRGYVAIGSLATEQGAFPGVCVYYTTPTGKGRHTQAKWRGQLVVHPVYTQKDKSHPYRRRALAQELYRGEFLVTTYPISPCVKKKYTFSFEVFDA
eukprot:5977256-Amphidinium_carterae.1